MQLEALKAGEKPAAAASAPKAKKPLSLADADTWRSVHGDALSPDGKWFAYRTVPAEGDGEVILRANADGKETKFPGGHIPSQQYMLNPNFFQPQFSADSKWLAFSVTPYTKPGATTSGPRPK